MRIISFLTITLAVCLSVTTDAMPNTDHASAIVPEEELSLVGRADPLTDSTNEASNPEQKGIWDDCDTSYDPNDPNAPAPCQVRVKEAVVENLNPLKESQEGVDPKRTLYPSADQMKALSGIAGTTMDLISATKQKDPSALYGQGLQLISEVTALVPVEPISGFISLVAGIGATFFLSKDAPQPPTLTPANIQTAVSAALAKFQVTQLEDTAIPTMVQAVMMRYHDLLHLQGPTSPVSDGNAKFLYDTLTDGMTEICGTSSGSASEVLQTLGIVGFGSGSKLEDVKNSLQFNRVPVPHDLWPHARCDNCGFNSMCLDADSVRINQLWRYWPDIKTAAQQWLLGYYNLLQYGSAVFQTLSVNSKNQAFLKQYSGPSEDTQGADIFNVFHTRFISDCGMDTKATLANALQNLLTFMGPNPVPVCTSSLNWNVCVGPMPRDPGTPWSSNAMCASPACVTAFSDVWDLTT